MSNVKKLQRALGGPTPTVPGKPAPAAPDASAKPATDLEYYGAEDPMGGLRDEDYA